MQNLASMQKRTSPTKFDHLAEKSEEDSISNLSTKAEAEEARVRWYGRRGAARFAAVGAAGGEGDGEAAAGRWVERFDRRGTEPFELFRSEFGQNS